MNEQEIARLEAANGFKQLSLGVEIIRYYLEPNRPFALRPGLMLDLQKVAVAGLVPRPGEWRRTNVAISKSAHQPPPPHLVENLVTKCATT